MPGNVEHKFISEALRKLAEQVSPEFRKILGEQGKTHSNMDAATNKPFFHFENGKIVNKALGPNHRKIGHDPISIGLMSLFGKVNLIDAGLHLLSDSVWTGLKDIVFNRKKK